MTEHDAAAAFAAASKNVLQRVTERDRRLWYHSYSLYADQIRAQRNRMRLKRLSARIPLEYESRTKVTG